VSTALHCLILQTELSVATWKRSKERTKSEVEENGNYNVGRCPTCDGRPAEYRWRLLRKFRNSIPCNTPQSLADVELHDCWPDPRVGSGRVRKFTRLVNCLTRRDPTRPDPTRGSGQQSCNSTWAKLCGVLQGMELVWPGRVGSSPHGSDGKILG